MKFIIASDIHGCAPACRKLLDSFAASGADRLILLEQAYSDYAGASGRKGQGGVDS